MQTKIGGQGVEQVGRMKEKDQISSTVGSIQVLKNDCLLSSTKLSVYRSNQLRLFRSCVIDRVHQLFLAKQRLRAVER